MKHQCHISIEKQSEILLSCASEPQIDQYGLVSLVIAEAMAIGDPQELPSGSGAGGRGSAAATRGPDTPRAGQRPLRRQGPLNLDGT